MHDLQYVFNPVIFKGFDGKYHYLYMILQMTLMTKYIMGSIVQTI